MGDVYGRVLAYVERHGMFSPGDAIVVAVSGGADSVALLHVMGRLAKRMGLRLHAGHLNHLLRADQAEEDARFVADLARSLGIPCTVGREDVAARAASSGTGLEEAGREARYAFLGRLAGDVGARRIALGHTRDDQAETVLMRIIRGAGIEGLAGIPPVRGSIVRPLLRVGHAELEEYCRQQGLTWRVDPYNFDPGYLRNRVRHHLLPCLEEVAGAGVRERLAELAEALRPDVEWLRGVEEQTLADVSSRRGEGVLIDLGRLPALPPALRRRVLRRAILTVKRPGRQVGLAHVQAVLDLLGGRAVPEDEGGLAGARSTGHRPAAEEVHLPGGVVARLTPDGLALEPAPGEAGRPKRDEGATVGYRYRLPVPGLVEVPEAGLLIHAAVVRDPVQAIGHLARRALLDYNKTGAQLLVRSWRPGDRFFPLGMESPKKLHDFFVDEKVPRVQRQRIPLVLSGDEIIWVVGYRIDHRYRVTPATREALVLEACDLEEEERGA
ncbi:MAG: tRNA lysidine(34) synthetase TilS [Bacillota bacterium]|nr:tRNA lysidine(34) synthetase TilS [Bacillota bacterium]